MNREERRRQTDREMVMHALALRRMCDRRENCIGCPMQVTVGRVFPIRKCASHLPNTYRTDLIRTTDKRRTP